jgi:hypothetical protein
MSWLFCDSICDSLLQPLQVLVQEPLLLQYHCGEDAKTSVPIQI